jgi:hypothetical protein
MRAPDGSSVWRVVARAAPALVTLHSGFADPLRPKGSEIGFPLLSPSGVGYFEIRAREAGVIRLVFDAQPPEGQKRVLRVADSQTEVPFTLDGRTHISVRVAVPSGLSLLLLKTDPAATSPEDAIDLTAPNSERAAGPAQLQADLISSDIGF